MNFKYDSFGRRIYKSSSAGTSVFAYDGINLVEETNSSGCSPSANGENRLRPTLPLVGVCLAAIMVIQACRDRQEYFYATLAYAVKAGEITRGWIPDFLPASSHAIHLIYDPSSPRTWCVFEFSPSDSQSFKKHLKSVGVLPQLLKHVDGPGVSWWPLFLTGELDIAKLHANGFDSYVEEEPDVQSSSDLVLFAIDWTNGRAIFYRTPGGP
jgi:hypothetical protein